MNLEGHLTEKREEQQLGTITAAETAFLDNTRGPSPVDYGKFAVLYHPYIELANEQGYILLMSLVWPSTPQRPSVYDSFAADILAPGGSIKFDGRYNGSNWLGRIKERAPHEVKLGLSITLTAVWEMCVLQYVIDAMPVLEDALKLPELQSEDDLGFGRSDLPDLLDLATNLQTYLIAKTLDLEAVKPHVEALQRGVVIYHQVLSSHQN